MANNLDMSSNITAISGVACKDGDHAQSRPEPIVHESMDDEHGHGLPVLRS